MANPAVSLLSKRAPLGDRFLVTATLTWATYAQAAADKVTAASLGLVYIDELFVSISSVVDTRAKWDGVKGASPGITLLLDDDATGEADVTAGARTDVVHIQAIGF